MMFALTLDMPPSPYLTTVMAYRCAVSIRPSEARGPDRSDIRYEAGSALTTSRQDGEAWDAALSLTLRLAEASLAVDWRRPEEDRAWAHLEDEAWVNYRPKTALGKKLLELRRAYLASGGKLLSAEALDEEMRERRGRSSDD